ncbi:hypothetical protein MPTK1_3g04680 [Marchantia polymorpha subsp. ruderalis]|uniref:phosphoglycerate mutase (2,3-diphosphoglycerate-dependent) n=2 Tax=Marchantia polymorpha TaxID=3197 RepID=A0AAF6AXG1_MARPO|nr:hypothetical protein MARPO_0022s0061 [Marchantia polymorpha]BBN04445.1 hypothetical protein Mp_3g04680 [Marchantia polymorpha subsp. ruderalis]|eukprot:PTQ43957.1 hypothetical protein MARPO_0022s0061 [Marchantia polymorpha]
MRPGESMWNDLKLFTGDVDIPLTEKGVMEALAGGKAVSEVDFDIIFTRRLVRSKQTALNAMTQDTYRRTTVFFEQTIEARLKEGKNVLVVAHGNVLRCINTYLSGLSVDEMLALQVATALPYAYAYNGHCFAQHCLLPPTHSDIHHSSWGWDGTASASKKGDLDSLI